MTEPEGGRDWLSATLRQLRKAAGLSAAAVAQQLGTSSRRISNIETGRFLPREDEVTRLAKLYGAKAADRRRMIGVVQDLSTEPPRARAIIAQHGAHRMQQRYQRAENESARIRSFHPAMVIGLAQTPAYMRAVFSEGAQLDSTDLERSIAVRIARAEILGTGKDISLIQTEGALRWQAISPAVMTEQLARLAVISQQPGVQVGIIPWTTAVRVFPITGFHIYDSRAVVVGTDAATAFFADSQDVALYEKLWTELEDLAAWNDQARDHLDRIAADYRGLRNPRG